MFTKETAFKHEPIKVNGNVVNFDGKYRPGTKTLKIYRMYGDIRLYDEAIMNFCIEHHIDKCETKF